MIGTHARRLAAAAVVLASALAGAPPAAAMDPLPEATAALRTGSLYVAPEVTGVTIDQGLAGALPNDLKIAVLPASAGPADVLATEISHALGAGPRRSLTIGVVTVAAGLRITMRAASSKYCPGDADGQAEAAASTGRPEFQSSGDLTPIIQDFAERLDGARIDGDNCPGTAGGGGSSAGMVWVWLSTIAALGAGGIGLLLLYRRRRKQREIAFARRMVAPYYGRLAHEINTLDPNDNAVAGPAMADASERFASAGGQVATADSVEAYALARRTSLEGLHATRTAREALGLDPGPPLPPIEESEYEQLSLPQQITIQGQQVRGYPTYTPGAPHYFGGGWGVPGGWYGVPFWETLALGNLLGAGRDSGAVFDAGDIDTGD